MCWSLFKWCLLLGVAAALTIVGYLYFRLDDEIRRQVQQRLASHYDSLQVTVGSARFDQDQGIAVFDIEIRRPQSTDSQPMLVVDEMYLAGKLRLEDLVSDRLCIDEVILKRAEMRAVRTVDGRWNVKSLLPLPDLSKEAPVLTIEDTTLVLEDAARAEPHLQTIHGIQLKLTPESPTDPGRRYKLTGSASGLPAHHSQLEGDLSTSTGEMDVTLTTTGLELSPSLFVVLPESTRQQFHGTEVGGRADVTVKLVRADFSEMPRWSVSAKIDHGRLAHPLLPVPLNDIDCTCVVNADRLRVERLVASCGTGKVAIAMERAGWAPNAQLSLAAKVVGLTLNEQIRTALPEKAQRIWERFDPRGPVDAEFRLQFDGQTWRPQLTADCRGISLTDSQAFPYRLQQTTGRVEYWPAQVDRPDVFKLNLTGNGGGRPVKIDVELHNLAKQTPTASGPIGFVEVSGTDIPLHEELIIAIPDKGEALVRSLQPQGAVDFRFRADWKSAAQTKAEVTQHIRLKNCSVCLDEFKFPLRNVNGLVTEANDIWTLHDIEGRGSSDSTVVVCRGVSTPQNGEFRTDLTISGTNVGLDDTLKVALPPAVQQGWDELRPQGRIDFTAHVIHVTNETAPQIEVRIEPREQSVSIEPAKFRYRFDQISGVALYRGGQVELQNLAARHDRATFNATAGLWRPRDDGGWQIDFTGVSADRLAPRDLLVALPPDARHAIERLQPTGTFTVYNSAIGLAKSPRAPRLAAGWDVHLVCQQASLQGSPLRSMTGEVHLVGRDDGQTVSSAGQLSLDSVVCKDMQFTNVRGPIWLEPTRCLLGEPASHLQQQTPQRLEADVYGGRLAANLELQHSAAPAYNLDVAVGGVSLARFANERLGGPKDMNGTVSGRLIISGAGSSYQSLRGMGEMQVVDANIYELPPLVAMLKVLRNRTPNSTAFNRCDAKFTVEGEHVQFERLNLLGDAVSLYGQGESGLDRKVDLTFYTLIEPANLPIPGWKTIAGEVSKQTLQLKVDGTWDKVDVVPQTLPGVNQVWEQIQAGAASITPAMATRDGTGAAK